MFPYGNSISNETRKNIIAEALINCSMIRATLATLATGFMAFSDMGFTGVQERDKGIPVQLVVRVRGHEREQGIPVQLGVRVQGREQGIPVQLGVRVQEHFRATGGTGTAVRHSLTPVPPGVRVQE